MGYWTVFFFHEFQTSQNNKSIRSSASCSEIGTYDETLVLVDILHEIDSMVFSLICDCSRQIVLMSALKNQYANKTKSTTMFQIMCLGLFLCIFYGQDCSIYKYNKFHTFSLFLAQQNL